MFEKRVILIQLGTFMGLLLAIFVTASFKEKGVISSNSLNYFIAIEMISCAVITWTLVGKYQRGKIFRPLIEDELRNQGYELISERPLQFNEIIGTLEVRPTILINGMPLESYSYKARNERMLHVRTTEGTELLLHAVITRTWKNKIKLVITKRKRLE